MSLEERVAQLEAEVKALREALANRPEAITAFEAPFDLPPLDTPIRWTRKSPMNTPQATHSIVSLVCEHDKPHSFAWPLYVELRGSNDPAATMQTAQDVAATVRMYNRGPGAAWTVGYHADIVHGGDYYPGFEDPNNPENSRPPATFHPTEQPTFGTSIGCNVELTRFCNPGRAIGVNVLTTDWSTGNGDEGILVKGSGPGRGWNVGIHLEKAPSGGAAGTDAILIEENYQNGMHIKTALPYSAAINLDNGQTDAPPGSRGVWIQGQYEVGLDLGPNNLRMSAGSKVFLEETEQVYLRFNRENGWIEFVYEPRGVVAYIDINPAGPRQL